MTDERHLLINGLSIGSGGGYTVGRELARHLASDRPAWRVTLALVGGHPLHEQMRGEVSLPSNLSLHWAPPAAAGRVARSQYEGAGLTSWATAYGVDRVLQLNGMIVPALRLPTLCHNQDPWPYRPEAWDRPVRDRVLAFAKRRGHARAMRRADSVGFTSRYLRDLMVRRLKIAPRRSNVFYNGLPQDWIDRAAGPLPSWGGRPLEIVSVSNVGHYKRQHLVIRALPAMIRRPGLVHLRYRIAGHVLDDYRRSLTDLSESLGVGDRVTIEGRVSDARVRELLASARAFVLMSVCESFGIPAIEAMSFGTPVVTSDCCAMPEVCGAAADLCPVDDVAGLTERLAAVLLDPAKAERMRAEGARQVARFQWRETAAAMARELERLGEEA